MKLPKTEEARRKQAQEFDDMLKKALVKREDQIKQIMAREAEFKKRKKIRSDDIKKRLNKFISVPIVIGITAAIITYYRFGWASLEQTLLSWTIGVTVVTTVIALMEKYAKTL